MTYTPGPWAVDDPTRTHRILKVRGPDGKPLKGEDDARLIAAAPDLLAALKVMVLTSGILAHLEVNDPKALLQAQAAIAKAEGRA